MLRSVQNKILLISTLFTISFLIYGLIDKYNQTEVVKSLYTIRKEEKNNLVDRIVKLQGSSIEIMAYDYTFWDEMVTFTRTRDTNWAYAQVATGLPSYKANFIWIYDVNYELLYSYNNINKPMSTSFPLDKNKMSEVFSKNIFSHFFVQLDTGFVEIRTAPIQPSTDVERKSKPQGYFIVGRLWSEEIIKELSNLTESDINIEPDPAKINYKIEKTFDKDDIILSRDMNSEDGKKLFQLNAYFDNDLLSNTILKFYNEKFLTIIMFSAFSIILLLFLLMKWVSAPLKKLSASLNTENTNSIEKLQHGKDEFGKLAQMIIIFFKQKKSLVNEITEHKNTLESLLKSEEKIKISLHEKEILIKEVHHRVKNNLQIISSLLKLQSVYLEDKKALEIFKESQNRVKTMALIHERLYRSNNISQIYYKDYIEALISNLIISYGTSTDRITIKYDIDDIVFDIDTALPCSLIINELVSNCLKYAFCGDQTGNINISVKKKNLDEYMISVGDNGKGFPSEIDYRNTETLGLQLVNTLVEQLDASLKLTNSEGTKFDIYFKTATKFKSSQSI